MYMKDQALVFFNKTDLDQNEAGTYKDLAGHAGAFGMYGQDKALALVITIHETAVTGGAGTDAQTYNFKLVMADSSGGSNATTVIDETPANADITAGRVFVFPIPKLDDYKRYWKVQTTVAGLAPDGNFSASIDPVDATAHYKQYASTTGA